MLNVVELKIHINYLLSDWNWKWMTASYVAQFHSIQCNTKQYNTLAYNKKKQKLSSVPWLPWLFLEWSLLLFCLVQFSVCIFAFYLFPYDRTSNNCIASMQSQFRMVHRRLWTIDRQIIGYNRASGNRCEKNISQKKINCQTNTDRRNNKMKSRLPIKSCSSWSSLLKFSRYVTFRHI